MIQTGKYLHPGENDLNMCLSLSQNGLKTAGTTACNTTSLYVMCHN